MNYTWLGCNIRCNHLNILWSCLKLQGFWRWIWYRFRLVSSSTQVYFSLLFFYHFVTRGRVTAKLGDVDSSKFRCFLLRIFHHLSIGFIGFSLDFVFQLMLISQSRRNLVFELCISGNHHFWRIRGHLWANCNEIKTFHFEAKLILET